jgi:hypothetical protein
LPAATLPGANEQRHRKCSIFTESFPMGFFKRSTPQPTETDEQAIERYRYLLRTAPPDAIEQAHEEAFSRLTPDQRRIVLDQLSSVSTEAEMRTASDDPRGLARLATRAEVRQPGVLERLFGSVRGGPGAGMGGGMGFGGMIAGSLLGSIAGTVIGSAIAHSFFDQHPMQDAGDQSAAVDQTEADAGADQDFGDFGGDLEI